jgi:hypothetical protein
VTFLWIVRIFLWFCRGLWLTVDSGEMIWVLRGYGGFAVGFVVFFLGNG